MKQNSKVSPEVARIMEMMEKKNKVPKKRKVTKYQLSKDQYLKLLEENNQNKCPQKYIFQKEESIKQEKNDK